MQGSVSSQPGSFLTSQKSENLHTVGLGAEQGQQNKEVVSLGGHKVDLQCRYRVPLYKL